MSRGILNILFVLIFFQGSFVFGVTRTNEPSSVQRKVDACFAPIRKLGQFIIAQPGVIHFPYENSFKIDSPPKKTPALRYATKAARALQEMGGTLEFFFSPLPVRFVKGPTTEIFQKLWKDSKYKPSESERATLQKYKAEQTFDERQAFVQKWPRWVKFQRSIVWARRVALTASLVLALNHGFQVGAHPVTQKEYLEKPALEIQSNQVQLINEVVPFPHTSLRIGDKVYSYGYTHLSVKTPSEYFASRRDWEGAFVEEAKQGSSSAHPMGALASTLGKLPRSVQVITLNLTQTERDNLKRDMELAAGDRYYNVTFVNDCTTMILRALDRNTSLHLSRLIDASPSQMAFYFSSLKSAGSSKIGPVYQVAIDESSTHFLRNLYMNTLESKIFIDLFIYDQAHRLYVDIFKSPADLQSREPSVELVVKNMRRDIEREIEDDTQILRFKEIGAEMSRLGSDPADKIEFRKLISEYFEEKIQKAISKYQDPDSDFKDIIANESRITALTETRDQLIRNLR